MKRKAFITGILLLIIAWSVLMTACSPKKTEAPSTEVPVNTEESTTEETIPDDGPEGLSVEEEYTVELDDHQGIDGF